MPKLTPAQQAMLDGRDGIAPRDALRLLIDYASAVGAPGFIDVAQAHIDGCLHHGEVSLDFVEHFVAAGGKVKVPTTLNVGSLDLLHPHLFKGSDTMRRDGRRLMEAHVALGCEPSFTCAPYQGGRRPKFGEQIAWAESNAIVFANSVIGARTNRYGDFLDLCCALAGLAPDYGLHRSENRRAQLVFALPPLKRNWRNDALCVAVGHVLGERAGDTIAAITGLPAHVSEDDLKALGAVAASSGAVALFHAVGLTPEAPDLGTACQGETPETITLTEADLVAALQSLSTVKDGAPLAAISLGTPHFSLAEFARLLPLIDGFAFAHGVRGFINCSRATLALLEARGEAQRLRQAGFALVVDTCTYVSAIMGELSGPVMTNSGKWAHYAPGNLKLDVAFGSLEECIASAARGFVTRQA